MCDDIPFYRVTLKSYFEEKFMARKKKKEDPKQYLLMVGNDGYPWEAYHMNEGISDENVSKAREDLQEQFPNHEVRLYLCKMVTVSKSKISPYQRIKKLKHIVKSSAEWIKDNHRTAICNVCGAMGPEIPMNSDGNSILYKAGWFKGEQDDAPMNVISSLFGRCKPEFTLRCPSCDEQAANKDHREDWFV